MDVFIEKIVVKKKDAKDALFNAGIFLAGFILFLASMNFAGSAALIVLVAEAYIGYLLLTSRNVEFEYAVTNGELDVDKIIAQRKRKRLFSGSSKEIEIVAKLKSDRYTKEYESITNRVEAVSSMEAENIYFAVAHYSGKRTIVFFEPDQRMLDSFKTYIPRKFFEN